MKNDDKKQPLQVLTIALRRGKPQGGAGKEGS
jgi:hypothetical protein